VAVLFGSSGFCVVTLVDRVDTVFKQLGQSKQVEHRFFLRRASEEGKFSKQLAQ